MSESPLHRPPVIAPASAVELNDLVSRERQVLAVGNLTKPSLSCCPEATLVSLRLIRGLIEYEPSEFTFTALAGTPIQEIIDALAQRRQYLPFDPLLAGDGATLGGTVASGLAGPGRFRFGGVRDFILGVEFLSGDGNLIRAGGKVVKNAAGFDIPKLFVGSLGRLGVLTRMTMKVFPRPIATRTLLVKCDSHLQAVQRIAMAASARWELDAVDYRPDRFEIILRLAGPDPVNMAIAADIGSSWGSDVHESASPDQEWSTIRELNWNTQANTTGINSSAKHVIKLPTTPTQFLRLEEVFAEVAGYHSHLSVAGSVLWIVLDDKRLLTKFSQELEAMKMGGLVIRGEVSSPLIGYHPDFKIHRDIKLAMDPKQKFPGY